MIGKNKPPFFPQLIFNLLCSCSLVFVFLWKKTHLPLIFLSLPHFVFQCFVEALAHYVASETNGFPFGFRWTTSFRLCLWNSNACMFTTRLGEHAIPTRFSPSTFPYCLNSHLSSEFLFPLIWTLATLSLVLFCAYGMFEQDMVGSSWNSNFFKADDEDYKVLVWKLFFDYFYFHSICFHICPYLGISIRNYNVVFL